MCCSIKSRHILYMETCNLGNAKIRDYTISMKEGGWRDFSGAVEYFRHMLMGHEILFKVFNGPQNIFYVLFS